MGVGYLRTDCGLYTIPIQLLLVGSSQTRCIYRPDLLVSIVVSAVAFFADPCLSDNMPIGNMHTCAGDELVELVLQAGVSLDEECKVESQCGFDEIEAQLMLRPQRA
jgi:hypothetical protein